VTIAEIAREAGVSIATVSKVLNGHTDVSERTRLVVQRLLEEQGYRRRRTTKRRLIELVIGEVDCGWCLGVMAGVEDVAGAAGFGVALSTAQRRTHSSWTGWTIRPSTCRRSAPPTGPVGTEVTTETRQVMGVDCVVVRDTATLDGSVIEDTFDWFAQADDGAVWYFGEDTKDYEDGEVVSTDGSWEAGVDGAQPGIVMPAELRVGDRYRQEYYLGEAEDMAEVLSLTEQIEVPAGAYDQVVMTKDFTPLEPDVLEQKYYARGVGMILAVQIRGGTGAEELVEFAG
jgi:hypothetical protein